MKHPASIPDMRSLPIFVAFLLGACAPPPPPAPKVAVDPVTESWYAPVTARLADLNRQAEGLLKDGKADAAATLVTQGQALAARLLTASRPTLAAMEAASDLDRLYANMLLGNHNLGWARITFQKNLSRWKNWRPQTAETARRLKLAQDGIAQCDLLMAR